jgi:hypothetical protein
MTVFVSMYDGGIQIMARAEGPDAIGDLVRDIGPGESFLGLTFDQWAALGNGQHDIDVKQPAAS